MQGQEYPLVGERTMRIKRIEPISYGKIQGAIGLLVGLIIGGFFALMSVVGVGLGSTMAGRQGAGAGVFAIVFGIGAVVFLPLFYGIAGFVAGVIGALFYNLVARFAGGLEITVE